MRRNGVFFPVRFTLKLITSVWAIAFASLAFGQTTAAAPDWQIAAGGNLAFEVASIRLTKPGAARPPSIPMENDDAMRPSGGTFRADFPVWVFIQFAYKLNADQCKILRDSLPKWATGDPFSRTAESYSIQAKSEIPNPTKDQLRLMMQSLLAERFHLQVHFEMKDMPVLALSLQKPAVLGPKLLPHEKGPPCDAVATISAEKVPSFFPITCGDYSIRPGPTGGRMVLWGSRNTTMDLLAAHLNDRGDIGKPVVDRSGLNGRFDFTMQWTMEYLPVSTPVPPDTPVTTFLEALKDQLGMKLEPTRAAMKVLVVDSLERPTEN
jgi:bla regulator protein blaR1